MKINISKSPDDKKIIFKSLKSKFHNHSLSALSGFHICEICERKPAQRSVKYKKWTLSNTRYI
ncbi:MAG: hypothetical protein ABH872_01620 [Candidatus Omnitrophota bacterium]